MIYLPGGPWQPIALSHCSVDLQVFPAEHIHEMKYKNSVYKGTFQGEEIFLAPCPLNLLLDSRDPKEKNDGR